MDVGPLSFLWGHGIGIWCWVLLDLFQWALRQKRMARPIQDHQEELGGHRAVCFSSLLLQTDAHLYQPLPCFLNLLRGSHRGIAP